MALKFIQLEIKNSVERLYSACLNFIEFTEYTSGWYVCDSRHRDGGCSWWVCLVWVPIIWRFVYGGLFVIEVCLGRSFMEVVYGGLLIIEVCLGRSVYRGLFIEACLYRGLFREVCLYRSV